jgi:glucose-1-phosphate cytidylyltransferase
MKTVILAGGFGTRLSEETGLLPKPMVEIGGKPIIWHIMKLYSHFGFNEFIILTGYKSHIIKDFFINYYMRYSDLSIDMSKNTVSIHSHRNEPWKVTLLYTGENTMTGGRLLQAKKVLCKERFMLTYGDGVSDVDIPHLLEFHKKSRKIVTLTAVRPTGRFGSIKINSDCKVESFIEKPENENTNWINGGFFVMEPEIFNYLSDGPATVLEKGPLEKLSLSGGLNAFKHYGFWKPMDTLKDKNELTEMWVSGNAPWATWIKDDR